MTFDVDHLFFDGDAEALCRPRAFSVPDAPIIPGRPQPQRESQSASNIRVSGYEFVNGGRVYFKVFLNDRLNRIQDSTGTTYARRVLQMLAEVSCKWPIRFKQSSSPQNTNWRFDVRDWQYVCRKSRELDLFGDGRRSCSVYVAAKAGEGLVVVGHKLKPVGNQTVPTNRIRPNHAVRFPGYGWIRSLGWGYDHDAPAPAMRSPLLSGPASPLGDSVEDQWFGKHFPGPPCMRRVG